MTGEGWWVERDPQATEQTPYCPTLQTAGGCFSLPIWFSTEEACEQFIHTNILGQGLLD